MRITNKMLHNTFLQNLDRNKNYLEKIHNRLSSGKMLNRPSDDPVAVSRVMSFKNSIAELEQFERNMNDANGWLETSEIALGSLNNALQRARVQAVYGSGGTLTPEAMNAIAVEINELIKEVVQIANSTHGSQYIFGGTHTTQPPYELNVDGNGDVISVDFHGDTSDINFEISNGVLMPVNASEKAFADLETINVLIDLKNFLASGDEVAVSNILTDIDRVIDNALSERANLGARNNRMNAALERNATSQLEFKKMMSRLEDTDLAKASIDYNVQEATYYAAIQSGAKLLQPTLLDFLR